MPPLLEKCQRQDLAVWDVGNLVIPRIEDVAITLEGGTEYTRITGLALRLSSLYSILNMYLSLRNPLVGCSRSRLELGLRLGGRAGNALRPRLELGLHLDDFVDLLPELHGELVVLETLVDVGKPQALNVRGVVLDELCLHVLDDFVLLGLVVLKGVISIGSNPIDQRADLNVHVRHNLRLRAERRRRVGDQAVVDLGNLIARNHCA